MKYKITIQPEKGDKIVFENVAEYFLSGMKIEKMIPQDFTSWHGTYKHLIGDLYYNLKDLERRNKDADSTRVS